MSKPLTELSQDKKQVSNKKDLDLLMAQFEAELRRLEKERQKIIEEYLEALRLKKIESLKKNLGV